MIEAVLLQFGETPQKVQIGNGTTPFDLCNYLRKSVDIKYTQFHLNGNNLDLYKPLRSQGIKDGDFICVMNVPKYDHKSLQDKIDSIILEALRIEDQKFDNLDMSCDSLNVYNAIANDIINNQVTPYDDLDYTDYTDLDSAEEIPSSTTKQKKKIPSEPLPPMWTTEEDDDKEFQMQIDYEIEQREFHTIEDAGERLSQVFSHGWRW